jgi:putative tricarboxylic transport membrane protein
LLVLPPPREGGDEAVLRGLNWGKVAALCGLMLFYGAAITRLGFLASTWLFLVGGILLLGERRWSVVLALSIGIALGFWAVLTKLLGIYLEPGLLL